jgi:hypothetical protein
MIVVGSLAYRGAVYIYGQIRDGFAARLAIAFSWSGGAVRGGSLWGKFEKLLPRSTKKMGKPIINEISDFEIDLSGRWRSHDQHFCSERMCQVQ